MNDLLKIIFQQWQEDRLDGKAEKKVYSYFGEDNGYTIKETIENHEYISDAMREIAERAFLVGFDTAVGLKDLLDGKGNRTFSNEI